MLALLGGQYLSRLTLPLLSSKFRKQPPARQQQLQVAVPLSLLKLTIALLAAEVELDDPSQRGRTKTPVELDYQLNLSYFLALGYIFELCVLRLPLESTIHHIFVMVASYAFQSRQNVDTHEARIDLYQIPMLMFTYGMGVFNVGITGIRLVYHCSSPTQGEVSCKLLYSFIAAAWMGLICQWRAITLHLIERHEALRQSLAPWERLVYPTVLAYWAWIEWSLVVRASKMAYKWFSMENVR